MTLRRIVGASTLVSLVLAAPGFAHPSDHSSTEGERFANKEEAARAGDPSGSAPSFALPSTATYNGKPIKSSAARSGGLVCVQSGAKLRCFDTTEEAEAATGEQLPERAPKGEAARKGRAASHDPSCTNLTVLALMQYIQVTPCYFTGNGWQLTLAGRQAWYNMGSYQNEASAYYMGNHSGHLSDYYDGLGGWYPGDTSWAAHRTSLRDTGWDERISSRYRN